MSGYFGVALLCILVVRRYFDLRFRRDFEAFGGDFGEMFSHWAL